MGRFRLVRRIIRGKAPTDVQDCDAGLRLLQGLFDGGGQVEHDSDALGGLGDVEALCFDECVCV